MPNTNGGQRNDLDKQILDEVRRGPRTQTELIREVGEAESKIRSRLQFLDGAGYVEQNEETGEYEFRDNPEEASVFEERPQLRWLAFAAAFLLSWTLYFYLLDIALESVLPTPPSVAIVVSVPFAWITAHVIVPPSAFGPGSGSQRGRVIW